jgi:hypothetical protein
MFLSEETKSGLLEAGQTSSWSDGPAAVALLKDKVQQERVGGVDSFRTKLYRAMKKEAYIARLARAIELEHGCKAHHLYSELVNERFSAIGITTGLVVEIFSLDGYAQTRFCYAWAYPTMEDPITMVLQVPPVISPTSAVRAARRPQTRAINLE